MSITTNYIFIILTLTMSISFINAAGNDTCSSNPCLNGASCYSTDAGWECVCTSEYTGPKCETTKTNCASAPCLNGGTCQTATGGFTCTCTSEYTGTTCSNDVDECETSSPNCGNGQCTNKVPGYTCSCNVGFTGSKCETNINDCASNPCQHGGTCVDKIGYYECTCVAGFSGAQCSINIDECTSNPCNTNSICHDGDNSYVCQCQPEFTGTGCDISVSAIACLNGACKNDAKCTPLASTFECTCPAGFRGTTCEEVDDPCSPNPCKNDGTCKEITTGLKFSCTCTTSWAGVICNDDVNECLGSNPCEGAKKSCVNTAGSYTCTCPDGLVEDSDKNCVAPASSACSKQCSNDGTCLIKDGQDTCVCKQGYTLENGDCAEINECALGIDDCDPSGECVNGGGTYTCSCPSPLTLSADKRLCEGVEQWGEWSACSFTCGNAVRSRTRKCKGAVCADLKKYDEESCPRTECPLSVLQQRSAVVMDMQFPSSDYPLTTATVLEPLLKKIIADAANSHCNIDLLNLMSCCGEGNNYKPDLTFPTGHNLVTTSDVILNGPGYPTIKTGTTDVVEIMVIVTYTSNNDLCSNSFLQARRRKRQADSSTALNSAVLQSIISDPTTSQSAAQSFATNGEALLGAPVAVVIADVQTASSLVTPTVQATEASAGERDGGVAWWIIFLAVLGALLLLTVVIVIIICAVKGGSAIHASQENLQAGAADEDDAHSEAGRAGGSAVSVRAPVDRETPRSADYRPSSRQSARAWEGQPLQASGSGDAPGASEEPEERPGSRASTAWMTAGTSDPRPEPAQEDPVPRPVTGSGARRVTKPPAEMKVKEAEEERHLMTSPPGTAEYDGDDPETRGAISDNSQASLREHPYIRDEEENLITHASVKHPVTHRKPIHPKPMKLNATARVDTWRTRPENQEDLDRI